MTHTPLTLRLIIACALGLPAAQASAACYAVYDAAGRLVRQADEVPANASQAGTVPEGGRVVLNGQRCTRGVAVAEQLTAEPARVGTPLLTPVQTAATSATPSPRRATETVITEWADGRVDVERRPLAQRH